MKRLIFYISLLLFISQTFEVISEEKRQELLNKLTKKISIDNFDELKRLDNSNKLKDTISYDPQIIKNYINQFGLPEEYNFLEDINATVRVKNQAACGCCWSHAATSALAYRFQKIGVDVDLSPQHGLSCYLPDCDAGNFLIDAQLNLVKNGTVTEECLPFSSADGETIEKCPAKCKDGSDMVKYYGQNTYMTEDYYSEDSFYDIVLIIMDQLTTKGPVVTGIDVYMDFMDWHSDPQKCHDEVYTYDGKSEFAGGHAITIVGYGYLNGKYYWLVQNSWGEEACDKGFVKIEFGQIGVEQVAFSEPYFHKEGVTPNELPVSLDDIDGECNLKVSTTSSYSLWENTLDLNFKNEKSNWFNFQCSPTTLPQQGKQIKCYYDYYTCFFYSYKGTYKLVDSSSLGEENKFNLDSASSELSFNYYGYDYLGPYYLNNFYLFISEEGSRILFYYEPNQEDEDTLPPIYPNTKTGVKPLSDCHKFQMTIGGENANYVYCDIKANEIDSFDDFSQQSDSPMIYQALCGTYFTAYYITYKLDKTKFPVFRFKQFLIPEEEKITSESSFKIIASVEGSISNFKEEQYFLTFIDIEKNGINSTYYLMCTTGVPSTIGDNHEIDCLVSVDSTLEYDNIYLRPYNEFAYEISYPFENIINEPIKGKKESEPDPEPEEEEQSDKEEEKSDKGEEEEHDEPNKSNYFNLKIFLIFILGILAF